MVSRSVGVAVTLYIFLLEVLGSNLGRDTGYPDSVFVVFHSPSKQVKIMSLQVLSNSSVILPFDCKV
jgi:hypothetical protein